jgi:hypothetical protein
MSRPSTKRVNTAPMAIASDGRIIVNAYPLTNRDSLSAAIKIAKESGLPVFVGIVVPEPMR